MDGISKASLGGFAFAFAGGEWRLVEKLFVFVFGQKKIEVLHSPYTRDVDYRDRFYKVYFADLQSRSIKKDDLNDMTKMAIRDYVFPLLKGKKKSDSIEAGELIGTGFLIGKDGFAVTASHVIDQLLDGNEDDDVILGLFVHNDQWIAVFIESFEKHDTEDVGVIKLEAFKRESFLKINSAPQHSSCEYHCWGYPHEVAKELSKLEENTPDRPDLIFSQGYIRRRISRELYPTIIFKGKQFYELSEIVGGGNSGGPIILKNSVGRKHWEIIGIYIGEKSEGNISYAVRAEAFAAWIPKILGKTVLDESSDIS